MAECLRQMPLKQSIPSVSDESPSSELAQLVSEVADLTEKGRALFENCERELATRLLELSNKIDHEVSEEIVFCS